MMAQDDWSREATNLLKAELARSGIGYDQLIDKLKVIGVDESYKGIAAKINRGTFSFVFFMQCMRAMGKNQISL
jgi:hypothetical protein